MLSYVFMKILEGRPRSYDKVMDMVSKGRVRAAKEAVTAQIPPGARVLEIGCGTGELAEMLVDRGITVDGFDLSPSMVAAARGRIEARGLAARFTVWEMGVEGMDTLPTGAYNAVVSTLVLSELSRDERRYALKNARRVLRPDGRIVVADEVVPHGRGARILQRIVRAPVAALTYLVTRSTTNPVEDLAGDLVRAGFKIDWEGRSHRGAFALFVAHPTNQEKDP